MKCSICGQDIDLLMNLPECEAEVTHMKCLKKHLDERWEFEGLPSNYDLQREKGVARNGS